MLINSKIFNEVQIVRIGEMDEEELSQTKEVLKKLDPPEDDESLSDFEERINEYLYESECLVITQDSLLHDAFQEYIQKRGLQDSDFKNMFTYLNDYYFVTSEASGDFQFDILQGKSVDSFLSTINI